MFSAGVLGGVSYPKREGPQPTTDNPHNLQALIWEFPKIGVPYLGVLIIRILLFRVLYYGPLFSETPIWHC